MGINASTWGLISRVSSRTYRNTHTLDTATMVNVPKARKTYCPATRKHQNFKVTQYKKGKESPFCQGRRRYNRKQSGYGGQTKPIFHKGQDHQEDCAQDGNHLRQGQEEVRHHEANQAMQVLRARW